MSTAQQNIVKSPLTICDCGIAPYQRILEYQHRLRDRRRSGEIQNTLLLVEHLPVITLGARKTANKLLVSRQTLKKRNIDVVDIRRGGGSTAHNPGQLVLYPILDLRQLQLGVNEYIRQLEAVGIELLNSLGLQTHRRKGYPGIWTDQGKIASIGVRVSRQITFHGMAINISNDLAIFDYMVPCGLTGIKMTSAVKETHRQFRMEDIRETACRTFIDHFSREDIVQYEEYT